MFQRKDRSADWSEPPQALVQGDDVVAVVFEPHLAELFSQAPQMLLLIQRVAAGVCEVAADGSHDNDCRTCEARCILATFSPAPLMH